MPAFDQRQCLFELGQVTRRFAGGDVHRHGDLEQAQAGGIEGLEPLFHFVEPDVADAGIAQLLKHCRLLGEIAFLGVVPVDAEREESWHGVGHAVRLGGRRRGLGGHRADRADRAEDYLGKEQAEGNTQGFAVPGKVLEGK